jgi:hypothetical protein
MQLSEFKEEFLELILQFLWRQWSSLGVAGHAESKNNWVIDPEALLLFSLSMTRYDQRLFDEILDWLTVNEKFINVQRLRTLHKKEGFETGNILHAVAAELNKVNTTPKWKKLAEVKLDQKDPKPLFYLKGGQPLPVLGVRDQSFESYGLLRNPVQHRQMSKEFIVGKAPALLLQLRSLFGVTARSEVMLHLLLHDKSTAAEITDQTYYSGKSIKDALFEMRHSGLLTYPDARRSRWYRLDSEPWLQILLKDKTETPIYICWPPLFRALEMIFTLLNSDELQNSSLTAQAAELRHLMKSSCNAKIEKAGLGSALSSNYFLYEAENYLPRFITIFDELLGTLNV